jgi:hypothetical protein
MIKILSIANGTTMLMSEEKREKPIDPTITQRRTTGVSVRSQCSVGKKPE